MITFTVASLDIRSSFEQHPRHLSVSTKGGAVERGVPVHVLHLGVRCSTISIISIISAISTSTWGARCFTRNSTISLLFRKAARWRIVSDLLPIYK